MNKPNQLDHTEKNMKAERQSVGKEISRSGRNTGLMGGGVEWGDYDKYILYMDGKYNETHHYV
jgi:hypothetical protein